MKAWHLIGILLEFGGLFGGLLGFGLFFGLEFGGLFGFLLGLRFGLRIDGGSGIFLYLIYIITIIGGSDGNGLHFGGRFCNGGGSGRRFRGGNGLLLHGLDLLIDFRGFIGTAHGKEQLLLLFGEADLRVVDR